MKYVATVQSNIIVAKGINYTDYVAKNEIELTKEQYDTIPIPCRLVDGEFIPCDYPEVEIAETNLTEVTRFELYSYTGTGTSGEANPCILTFSFEPKMVAMLPNIGGGVSPIINCDLLTTEYKENMSFYDSTQSYANNDYAKKSEDGKTIYWYVANNTATGPSNQYNNGGTVYTVLALG